MGAWPGAHSVFSSRKRMGRWDGFKWILGSSGRLCLECCSSGCPLGFFSLAFVVIMIERAVKVL